MRAAANRPLPCRRSRTVAEQTFAEKDLHLDALAYVRGLIRLPNLPPGDYTAQLTTFDRAGQALVSRGKARSPKKTRPKRSPGGTHGSATPRKCSRPGRRSATQPGNWMCGAEPCRSARPACRSRSRRRGGTCWRASLTSTADLARRQDGQRPKARRCRRSPRPIIASSCSPHSRLGALTVTSVVTTEFDGMYKVEMTLDAPKPTPVKSLTLVVPLKNEVADYLHACGEGIRYGFDYRFLPRERRAGSGTRAPWTGSRCWSARSSPTSGSATRRAASAGSRTATRAGFRTMTSPPSKCAATRRRSTDLVLQPDQFARPRCTGRARSPSPSRPRRSSRSSRAGAWTPGGRATPSKTGRRSSPRATPATWG